MVVKLDDKVIEVSVGDRLLIYYGRNNSIEDVVIKEIAGEYIKHTGDFNWHKISDVKMIDKLPPAAPSKRVSCFKSTLSKKCPINSGVVCNAECAWFNGTEDSCGLAMIAEYIADNE